MILIIDSWAWLAILEGGDIADKILQHLNKKDNQIFTTCLNIYEVYYRVKEKTNSEEAMKYIETIKKQAAIAEISEQTAISAGNIHIKERLPAVDAFTYAMTLRLNGKLLTGDPHFEGKESVLFLRN